LRKLLKLICDGHIEGQRQSNSQQAFTKHFRTLRTLAPSVVVEKRASKNRATDHMSRLVREMQNSVKLFMIMQTLQVIGVNMDVY